MSADQTDTIIGAQVEIKGSLHNHGPIQVHGKVVGDIFSDGLVTIGETAEIVGPIVARQVDVHGNVQGSITAEQQIELQPKSLVKGDLITAQLSIKPGAVFIGKSQMSTNGSEDHMLEPEPLDAASKKKPHLEIE